MPAHHTDDALTMQLISIDVMQPSSITSDEQVTTDSETDLLASQSTSIASDDVSINPKLDLQAVLPVLSAGEPQMSVGKVLENPHVAVSATGVEVQVADHKTDKGNEEDTDTVNTDKKPVDVTLSASGIDVGVADSITDVKSDSVDVGDTNKHPLDVIGPLSGVDLDVGDTNKHPLDVIGPLSGVDLDVGEAQNADQTDLNEVEDPQEPLCVTLDDLDFRNEKSDDELLSESTAKTCSTAAVVTTATVGTDLDLHFGDEIHRHSTNGLSARHSPMSPPQVGLHGLVL